MNTSEKLHKMIYAILCGDKDYTLHNLYALAWDAVIEDNGKDARIHELENALRQIANGEGYYGAQAKEYKDIARAALGE